jgi:heme exporter protein C
MDNNLRLVFYPAIIGFTLLGVWITELRVRMRRLQATLDE